MSAQEIVDLVVGAEHVRWVYDDGGRAAAGRIGSAGDCVTRAIAIATGASYQHVYVSLYERERVHARQKGRLARSPRQGVASKVYRPWLEKTLRLAWTPTMKIGSGCTVHLRADELPPGRLIVRCSRHLVAVIDGVIHDTYDPSRGGTRCVYGYWTVEP